MITLTTGVKKGKVIHTKFLYSVINTKNFKNKNISDINTK